MFAARTGLGPGRKHRTNITQTEKETKWPAQYSEVAGGNALQVTYRSPGRPGRWHYSPLTEDRSIAIERVAAPPWSGESGSL